MEQKEFTIESWDDIKDKPIKILIPNLEQAIEWMKKLGLDFEKDKYGCYWLKINYKENEKTISADDICKNCGHKRKNHFKAFADRTECNYHYESNNVRCNCQEFKL